MFVKGSGGRKCSHQARDHPRRSKCSGHHFVRMIVGPLHLQPRDPLIHGGEWRWDGGRSLAKVCPKPISSGDGKKKKIKTFSSLLYFYDEKLKKKSGIQAGAQGGAPAGNDPSLLLLPTPLLVSDRR